MSDVTLQEVLKNLSEETLYQLGQLVDRRVRKQALRVNGGKAPDDLVALTRLQAFVEDEHHFRLFGSIDVVRSNGKHGHDR
jgi:hypothetical protein